MKSRKAEPGAAQVSLGSLSSLLALPTPAAPGPQRGWARKEKSSNSGELFSVKQKRHRRKNISLASVRLKESERKKGHTHFCLFSLCPLVHPYAVLTSQEETMRGRREKQVISTGCPSKSARHPHPQPSSSPNSPVLYQTSFAFLKYQEVQEAQCARVAVVTRKDGRPGCVLQCIQPVLQAATSRDDTPARGHWQKSAEPRKCGGLSVIEQQRRNHLND